MNLPKARTENIVLHKLGSEVLLYNTVSNKAFCLNETSAAVYEACGGGSLDDLRAKPGYTDELIFLAVYELRGQGLVEDFNWPASEVTRREALRKVGLASVAALPIVAALITPTSANAQSTCLGVGQSDCRVTPCCPGLVCSAGCIGPGICLAP